MKDREREYELNAEARARVKTRQSRQAAGGATSRPAEWASAMLATKSAGEKYDLMLETVGEDSGHPQVKKAVRDMGATDREQLRSALVVDPRPDAGRPAPAWVKEMLDGFSQDQLQDLLTAFAGSSSAKPALVASVEKLSRGQRLDVESELLRRVD